MNKVAQQFKQARKDAGLSVYKVAKLSGMTEPNIKRLESGTGQLKNVIRLAEFYGIKYLEI